MAEKPGILTKAMWRLAPRRALSRSRQNMTATVVKSSPEFDAETKIREGAAALAEEDRFDAVLEIVQGQLSSRATTDTGLRCSEATLLGLFSIVTPLDRKTEASTGADAFRGWFRERGDHPDVAALVARALQIEAEIGEADPTQPEARARIAGQLTEALSILDGCQKNGMSRELWHRARFRMAPYAGDAEEATEQFERYVAFDRGNIQTYLDRAQHILPALGGDFDQIEGFARQSVERTAKMWKSAVYLQIYHTVSLSEDLLETSLDWDRLLQAFDDSLDLFPPIVTINGFIALAARLQKADIVRALFAELPELRMDLWEDEDEPFEVFAWANGDAPWPYAGGGKA